jgi:hypothetical protein
MTIAVAPNTAGIGSGATKASALLGVVTTSDRATVPATAVIAAGLATFRKKSLSLPTAGPFNIEEMTMAAPRAQERDAAKVDEKA